MGIFKAYDIRGVYPTELHEEMAYAVGCAAATFFGSKEIIVGRDMRESSDTLFTSLTEGIADSGVNIIDIGVVSSPMISFASGRLNKPGVMITASHNPREYNGFKLVRAGAIPVSGDSGIQEIERLVAAGEFAKAKKRGVIRERPVDDEYKEHVLSLIDKDAVTSLRVVVDAGNGMGGKIVPLVFSELSAVRLIPLYFELDGSFPNHEANPLKAENMAELRKRVISEKADLGIAFDGDADRVFFVSDKGEIVPADLITCIIGEAFLTKHKGGTVLYDLRSSWIVKEHLESLGAKTQMCRVGHSFIKEQLRKTKGIFAGELSGHFYFRDNYYADSGIIAALKVIELLSKKRKRLSELTIPLKKYFATGEINSKVANTAAKIRELGKKYADGQVSYLDGIRVDYKEWWFNVRASNTEPLLRLNLEAMTMEMMEAKKREVLSIINR